MRYHTYNVLLQIYIEFVSSLQEMFTAHSCFPKREKFQGFPIDDTILAKHPGRNKYGRKCTLRCADVVSIIARFSFIMSASNSNKYVCNVNDLNLRCRERCREGRSNHICIKMFGPGEREEES